MRFLFAVLAAFLLVQAETATAGELTVPSRITPVPYFQFSDGQGRKLELADFRGKVVILDVWATWCPPCRAEFPSFDRLQGKMKDRDVVVIPVSVDRQGMAAVDRFYRDLSVANLGKYVASQEISQVLGIRGIPTTLFIDREGREVGRVEGAARWDDPTMIQAIEMLLK